MNRAIRETSRFHSALVRSLLILIVVGGLACRKKPPAATDVNEPEPNAAIELPTPTELEAPTEAVSPAEPNVVVVTVNGREISEKDLNQRVEVAMRQFAGKLASLPPAFAAQVRTQLRQKVLDNLITERLLDAQVQAAGIQVTDADIVAEMERTAAAQQPPETLDDLKARVEAQGGSFEDLREEFRRGMGYRRLMTSQWGDKVNVTEEDAKAYYEEHPKEFETPEQLRASHILIAPDPNADPNEAKVVAKEKAQRLLQEIKDGADFAELAKEHSSCTSAPDGGDLKFFPRGQMVKPFEDAAFAMEPNQVSDVVESKFGYHIIKVTDHKDVAVIPLEEAEAGILQKLADEKRSAITQAYLQSLRDEATIVYPPAGVPKADEPVPAVLPGPAEG